MYVVFNLEVRQTPMALPRVLQVFSRRNYVIMTATLRPSANHPGWVQAELHLQKVTNPDHLRHQLEKLIDVRGVRFTIKTSKPVSENTHA